MNTMYDFSNIEEEQKGLQSHINDLKEQAQNETDPAVVQSLQQIEVEEKTRLLEALPYIKLVLPNLTFQNSLTIHGEKRTVELHCLGGGHSPNDTFLLLPEEKILFTGDLVFEKTHPSIHRQPPEEWIDILRKLKTFDVDTLVPGHGGVTDMNQFDIMLEYLTSIVNKVETAYQEGKTVEELSKVIPSEYVGWKLAHVYGWNLKSIFNQLTLK